MGSVSSLPLTYILLIIGFGLYFFVKPCQRFVEAILVKIEKLSNRKVILLLGLLTFIVGILAINTGNGWGDDSSQYVSQTKALLTGTIPRWMELNEYTIAHTKFGYAPVVYPWGLPLLLAPLYQLFGIHFYAFKIFELICFSLSTMVLYHLFLRKLPKRIAFVAILFFAFNYNYIHEIDDVYADIPAMLFCFVALDLIDSYRYQKTGWLPAVGIGCAILAAVLLRTASLALLIALFGGDVVYYLKKEKMNWIILCLPYVMVVGGYLLMGVLLPSSGSEYGSFFQLDGSLILSNIKQYYLYFGQMLGDVVSNYPDHRITFYLLTGLFLFFMVVGQVKHLKEEIVCNVYLCVSLLVLLIFYGISIRYVFPIFAIGLLFVSYAYMDMQENFHSLSKRVFHAIVVGVLTILMACDGVYILTTKLGMRRINYAYTNEAMEVYEVIRNTVKEEENVFFFKPRALLLQADVHTFGHDEKDSWKEADYLLIASEDPKKVEISDYAKENGYQELLSNDAFTFYRK